MSMPKPHQRLLLALGVALSLLAIRLWWVRPIALRGGPLLSEATLQAGNYNFTARPGVSTRAIVRAGYLDGYDPMRATEFRDVLETKPHRYEKVDRHHHYLEYIGKACRIQLHRALEEDGIAEWLEFLPSNLNVDSFFVPAVAIMLDSARNKYNVTIADSIDRSHLTATIVDGRVTRVSWSTKIGGVFR